MTWTVDTPITARHSTNDQSFTRLFVLVIAAKRASKVSERIQFTRHNGDERQEDTVSDMFPEMEYGEKREENAQKETVGLSDLLFM